MPSCFHFVATLARRALQGHGKHFLPIRHVPRFKFIFYCLKVIIYDGYHIVAWRFSRWCCCHIGLWSSPRILQGHKILPTNSTCTILIAAIKQIGVILLSGSNPTIRKCLFHKFDILVFIELNTHFFQITVIDLVSICCSFKDAHFF